MRTLEPTVSPADVPVTAPRTGAALLEGMRRQRTARPRGAVTWPAPSADPAAGPRPLLLLPTPTGTPFTFGYAAVLLGTSLFAEYADPSLVHSLYQHSSTDVAHLVRAPVPVLMASALWIAGGLTSSYALVFLLVLTALERRTGGMCTAAVFLLGHVLATLATEIPVGLTVLAGGLPDSSLHRLDYGISFGVAASLGALTGLLGPWPRWTVLVVSGAVVLDDLAAFADPLSDWGHLLALAVGIAIRPAVRRRARDRSLRGGGRVGAVAAPAVRRQDPGGVHT
ncbi:rhomboid-like protein [Streptomyces sp. NPDC048231]|uniref:rhomboid-like protein n=1 Tax=Streptomyces sp. NPDC048231 TaxID=3365519 RepID=UPI0037240138